MEQMAFEKIRKQNEEAEKKREEEEQRKKELDKLDRIKRYNEVKDMFVQQTTRICDSSGRRWVQCEICGQIKEDFEFSSYGGDDHVNLGECSECAKKKRQIQQ